MRLAGQEGQPEIFYTLQGEGRSVGEPATFIRLSGCNLQCVWCDTPYTWKWGEFERGEQQVSLDIGEAVDRITGLECQRVVITGGEPMTQQTGVNELIEHIKGIDDQYRIELETNGTILPNGRTLENVDQFNVSPKLSNSGMPYEKRIKPNVLSRYNETGKADFKFVVDTETDIGEVLQIVSEVGISKGNVYLMPQGRTEDEQLSREQWVAELCKKYQFNFTPRLQVALWGTKRGT